MANQWFYTRDGKKQFGPILENQLLKLIEDKKIIETDHLRREDLKSWSKLTDVLGLLKINQESPELTSISTSKVAVTEKVPPPLPQVPPPLLPETTGLGNLASGWFNSAKIAIAKAQEKTIELSQKINDKAQVVVSQAKDAASKANQVPNNATVSLEPKNIPPLVSRSIVPTFKTGGILSEEFAKCWNQIKDAEINVDELEFFGSTASKVEGSIANKLMSFFSSEKNDASFYSLAISKNSIFLVYSDPKGNICSVDYPFDDLDWSLSFKDGSENSGWFASASKNIQSDPWYLLNLKRSDLNHEIKLLDCSDIKSISNLISEKMFKLANKFFISGDYDSCEKYIVKIPVDSVHYAGGKELVGKIGLVAKGNGILQSGYPGYEGPVAGVLRYDSRGLSFYPSGDEKSFVYQPDKLRKIFEPKAGKFPPEYLEKIKSKKNSALAAVSLAKLGLKNSNPSARILAQTTLKMAVSRLNSIKIGPPFVNRICIISFPYRDLQRLVFDFSGVVKSEVDSLVSEFFVAVFTISNSWGKKSLKPQSSSVNKVDSNLKHNPKIVGCPKCKAKMRATKIGVIGCPRCKTKVRVK